jgi:hypothetical protein
MNFFEHKKGEVVSRLIILLALITVALDLIFWRP